MLKSMASFVTGTLCTLGLWFCQETQGEKRVVVGVVSSDDGDMSRDPDQLIAEMQELRAQLVAVLGPLHPTTRMLDARILQMSQPRSIAELVVGPTEDAEVYEAFNMSAWAPAQVTPHNWTFSYPPGADATPRIWAQRAVTSERLVSSYADRLAKVTGEPAAGLGQQIADLRQQWTETSDEEQRQDLLTKLRTAISEQFDADLARRREQVTSLEAKLDELRKQIEKRESRRDEFVDVLTKHTEMEWEGISLRKGNAMAVPFDSIYRPATAAPPAPESPLAPQSR